MAQVRLMPGNGNIIVNGKPFEQVFPILSYQAAVLEPLKRTDNQDKMNVVVKVTGGGVSGQAGAVRHGISRALVVMDEQLRGVLRKAGLMTRDPRVKERKKPGLKRARKAPQYTKR